ncbi:MAG TPA: glycoside hydrolase family 13 protein [Nocardioidaceae bacterium]|nr:glycoside hydrolase family 13 protein [Nocardioidaceae bacterium]
MPETSAARRTLPAGEPWWRHSVCYQIYMRSFADGNGDGVGDMAGIEQRLPYLADLGVDSVWITPFYTSPQHDHGYDVADYRDVDPLFGTLADFDAMLARSHELGIRVIVDLVPNHTSSEHEWFRAALAGDQAARERYVFRDGRGRDGARPPNNWRSVFGGPAWTRVEDGQWYLHMFDPTQPDLNWWNPDVGDEFESVLRFWLDRGVDGFRIDVAHGLFKPADLADRRRGETFPMWDQPEVHEVYRRWHQVLEEYDGDRMAVAEAWTDTPESMARYIRPDELQQAFNFHWLGASWSAAAFRDVVLETLAAVRPAGASATWVLSNHDVVRHVTRYGGGPIGVARGRAAVLTMLGLPGSAYVYQGEELGLEQVDVAPEDRQDPAFFRGGDVGRDGCRVPLPWSGATPPFGFGPGQGQPWLPQPAQWKDLTVEAQRDDPDSTLSFYRKALAARRALTPGLGDEVTMLTTAPGTLAFRRGNGAAGLVCMVNCGSRNARLPADAGELLLSSGALSANGMLPPDTAAWFRAT